MPSGYGAYCTDCKKKDFLPDISFFISKEHYSKAGEPAKNLFFAISSSIAKKTLLIEAKSQVPAMNGYVYDTRPTILFMSLSIGNRYWRL